MVRGRQAGSLRRRHAHVLTTTRDGLAGNDVQVIVEGADGAIWLGGARGLTRFANGVFTAFNEDSGLPTISAVDL